MSEISASTVRAGTHRCRRQVFLDVYSFGVVPRSLCRSSPRSIRHAPHTWLHPGLPARLIVIDVSSLHGSLVRTVSAMSNPYALNRTRPCDFARAPRIWSGHSRSGFGRSKARWTGPSGLGQVAPIQLVGFCAVDGPHRVRISTAVRRVLERFLCVANAGALQFVLLRATCVWRWPAQASGPRPCAGVSSWPQSKGTATPCHPTGITPPH